MLHHEPGQDRADEDTEGDCRQRGPHGLAAPVHGSCGHDQGQRGDPGHSSRDPLAEPRDEEEPVGAAHGEEQGGSRQPDKADQQRAPGAVAVHGASGGKGRHDHRHGVGGEQDSCGCRVGVQHRGQQREHRDSKAYHEHVREQGYRPDGERSGGRGALWFQGRVVTLHEKGLRIGLCAARASGLSRLQGCVVSSATSGDDGHAFSSRNRLQSSGSGWAGEPDAESGQSHWLAGAHAHSVAAHQTAVSARDASTFVMAGQSFAAAHLRPAAGSTPGAARRRAPRDPAGDGTSATWVTR